MSSGISPRRTDTAVRQPRTEPANHARRFHAAITQTLASSRPRMILALALLIGLMLTAPALGAFFLSWISGAPTSYEVVPGTMCVQVSERGHLESQDNVEILCELDDIHGDSIDGTPVLWIVANGARVKKGDLLVELDAAAHQERLDGQILATERARAEQIQAKARYENQLTLNETAKADSELRRRLAELDLQMFVDKRNGTHKLEVEEINRSIDDINNDMLASRANLELRKNEKRGIESLFKLGYAGKSELDRSRLDFLQAENAYASKMNRLRAYQAALEKKETYEREMRLLRLQGNVATARRNQEQALLNNQARIAEAKAAVDAAERGLKKQEERLARYRGQLTKCKIYAPKDGMVTYAAACRTDGAGGIGPGVTFRERQHILSMPNLSKMQVKTSVRECVIDRVREGAPATLMVDAYPDRRYEGTVKSVAVLPDQKTSDEFDTLVYETVVTIDEEVDHLKPGMTATVDIDLGQLTNVLRVPRESVSHCDGKSWCYVDAGERFCRRAVTPGHCDGTFVEIRTGLHEGDRVLRRPADALDASGQLAGTN